MPPPELGATVGVEEEYHLVDPETFALARRPELVARADAGELGPALHPEMLTSQLEAVTPVCRTLEEVHTELVRLRALAAAAAASDGATLLATSTHPFAGADEIEIMRRPRYDRLAERFGDVLRVNLCGCHVHVAVPDLDTAVAVSNRARPYLPLLVAISGSSPFYLGRDTGHHSFRVPLLAVLPQGGVPPLLESGTHFTQTVAALRAHGLVEDATGVLWSVRPSTRYPTVEFRIADVCPDVRDAVLLTALVRSLVRVLAARADRTGSELSEPLVRAACWRAARHGLTEMLWSPARNAVVRAELALDDLLGELRTDLSTRDELDLVAELLERRRREGGSAERQRRAAAERGSLVDVVRDAVGLTLETG